MKAEYTVFGGDGSGIIMVRIDTAKTSSVTVRHESGRPVFHVYKFPNVATTMQSPYISWANLNCCFGWKYDEKYLLTAVQDGKKLCAGLSFNTENELTAYLDRFNDSFPRFCKPPKKNGAGTGYWHYVDVTRQGLISDYIDMAAVQELYDAFGDIFKRLQFDKINELAAAPMIHLLDGTIPFDYGNPKTAEEYVITGLLLGYPIESTAALLLE
jgi:hypothetical protein